MYVVHLYYVRLYVHFDFANTSIISSENRGSTVRIHVADLVGYILFSL